MDFVKSFSSNIKHRYDAGDLVDRLNYQYTSLIISMFSLTMMAKSYVGMPIQCWVPAQFTGTWESYAETYCYIKNTFFLPLQQPIAQDYEERSTGEIGYYQWVPFVLGFQAMLFYLPSRLWRTLNFKSGLDVKSVLNAAAGVKKDLSRDGRDEKVDMAAVHIQEALDTQRDLKPSGRFLGVLFYGSHYGTYVTFLYLFIKLLYIANVIGQFFILNHFLGTNYSFWGFEILRDIINGRSWQESSHFPRVTMCDFNVRTLGNIHRWTVQCVLMINMFNEKIYIFLWWWFLAMAIATIVSLVYWILAAAFNQRSFVEKYLRVYGCLRNMSAQGQDRAVNEFVNNNLRPDGVLMLRMIQGNGGDLLAGELTKALWEKWAERMRARNKRMAALNADKESGFDDPLLAGKDPSRLRGGPM